MECKKMHNINYYYYYY